MTSYVLNFGGVFTDPTLPKLKNYILDNFATVDRTLAVAKDGDVAAPWTLYNSSSPWAVVSGSARPTVAAATRQIIGLNGGDADGQISTKIASTGSSMVGCGIVFRYISATDYCMVKYVTGSGYVVSHELNGVSTVVGAIAATAAANDTLTIRFIGTAVTLTVNATVLNLTFPYNLSAMIHGLASLWTSSNSPKYFKFEFTSSDDL